MISRLSIKVRPGSKFLTELDNVNLVVKLSVLMSIYSLSKIRLGFNKVQMAINYAKLKKATENISNEIFVFLDKPDIFFFFEIINLFIENL